MKKYYIIGALVIIAGIIAFSSSTVAPTRVGSVPLGSEYHATTTASITANNRVLQTGYGSLGSVIITGVTTGTLTVTDGTTTSPGADWGNPILAQFPASVAAGTYTFDTIYQRGLLITYTTGGYSSSTITFR